MAEITAAGIRPRGLDGLVGRLEAALRSALGSDLSVDPDTPQGQMAGTLGLVLQEAEELAVYVANGLNLRTVVGRQVADYGSLFDLDRIRGERSTVTATLSGAAGTLVPEGSRARTAAGTVFATDASTNIGAAGTADILMRSVDVGAIAAAAGELTEIVDAISGWTSVTNALEAARGRATETDLEWRRRYTGEVAANARDALETIRARVLAADGVTDALVRENTDAAQVTVQNVDIDAGSTLTIVDGGADADVAAAIAATKPAGGPTTGDVLVQVPHAQGFDIPIRFRRVRSVPIVVRVRTSVAMAFPSNGFALMRENLLAWFVGIWDVTDSVLFDQSGVGIGEAIDLARLRTPFNAVPGHVIDSFVARRRTDGSDAVAAAALAGDAVDSVAITAGGTGYATVPSVLFVGGGGAGATGTAQIAGGAVTAVAVTNGGAGYTSAPAVVFVGAELGEPDLDQRFTLAVADIDIGISV